MRLFPLFFLLVIQAACHTPSARGKQLAGSDSLVIHFNVPATNNIAKTVNTTEKKAISKLAGFADGKTAEPIPCGYDGNLLFYKKGMLVGDVSFTYSGSGCQHFIQAFNGELISTSMSNEAADFLRNLAADKDWY